MACFLVPAAEAIVTTAVTKTQKKKEGKKQSDSHIPFSRKLKWLTNLLWGGSILLAFEHLWHGEIMLSPPFLTAALDKADTSAMLHEMATVGVAMAVLITAVWGIMCLVTGIMERRYLKEEKEESAS